jgi:DNA-binding response OmpR family regulator
MEMRGVLIVEDDEDIRADLAAILRIKGFDVSDVANGREALELMVDRGVPCVILLDLMMPVMNGWELRAALKADVRFSTVPVIVMTGAGRLEDTIASLDAVAVLAKPFELQRLIELVARFCDPLDSAVAR